MRGHIRHDMIRNECIRERERERERVVVAPIVEKIAESRLRWFGHVEETCRGPGKESGLDEE